MSESDSGTDDPPRCWCGAYADHTEAGIDCDACGDTLDADLDLRPSGYEWTGERWVHSEPDGGEETVIVSTSAGHRGNTTYHRDGDCPSVQKIDSTTRKPLSALAGHYDPCERCHDMVIVGSSGYRRRYHRSETCNYVAESTEPERVPLASLDDEKPCSYCAIEDADESERGTIEVCPECDKADIQSTQGGFKTTDHDFRCRQCSATFDEPVTRPRKSSKDGKPKGLAGKLVQADPEDVSAEHVDGEPMTDGGVIRWD